MHVHEISFLVELIEGCINDELWLAEKKKKKKRHKRRKNSVKKSTQLPLGLGWRGGSLGYWDQLYGSDVDGGFSGDAAGDVGGSGEG